MRPSTRIYIRHRCKVIIAQVHDKACRIGIAAYRVANANERKVLETCLGPNAARIAGLAPWN
ncbi:hypothetical protein ABZU88_24960 [Streptomyces sp. NPDC005245]|uniref:hypothetical protein n=1 Tax=Streptomyces sp. NPDC005245 TaxID=3157029 RepID=UPI0033B83AAA